MFDRDVFVEVYCPEVDLWVPVAQGRSKLLMRLFVMFVHKRHAERRDDKVRIVRRPEKFKTYGYNPYVGLYVREPGTSWYEAENWNPNAVSDEELIAGEREADKKKVVH